jgi:hypothetical protein
VPVAIHGTNCPAVHPNGGDFSVRGTMRALAS